MPRGARGARPLLTLLCHSLCPARPRAPRRVQISDGEVFGQGILTSASAPLVLNEDLVVNQMAKISNERGCRVDQLGVGVDQVAELISMRQENQIGAQSIEPLLELLIKTDDSTRSVAEEAGMIVVLDDTQLEEWCRAAIDANEQAAEDVRSGKMAAIGRLMGHVMKSSGGSADAKVVQAKLKEMLS